jgi:hypothetical protein
VVSEGDGDVEARKRVKFASSLSMSRASLFSTGVTGLGICIGRSVGSSDRKVVISAMEWLLPSARIDSSVSLIEASSSDMLRAVLVSAAAAAP